MNASEANRSSAGNDSTAAGDTAASNDPLTLLGQTLRQAREQQGLSTGALASQLHMGEEQLTALEEADLARLPEPVFIIAQSRRVAAALGLDIDPLLGPLKQASAGQSLAAGTAARSSSGSVALPLPRPRNSPNGLHAGRLLGGAALAAGLVAAALWAWPQLQRQLSGPLNNRPPASPTVTVTASRTRKSCGYHHQCPTACAASHWH